MAASVTIALAVALILQVGFLAVWMTAASPASIPPLSASLRVGLMTANHQNM